MSGACLKSLKYRALICLQEYLKCFASQIIRELALVYYLQAFWEVREAERIKIDDKQGFGPVGRWVGGWVGLTNWTGRISSTSCSREWGGEVNNLYNFHTIISIPPIWGRVGFTTSPLDPPNTWIPRILQILGYLGSFRSKYRHIGSLGYLVMNLVINLVIH